MTVQTLKIGKERMVVMRERDYKKLLRTAGQQATQDAGDVAESWRRMREPGGISLADLRKRIGA